MKNLIFALLSICFIFKPQTQLSAEELVPDDYTIKDIQAFNFKSNILDQSFDISVKLPAGYDANSNKTYPTLIVTDGGMLFPIAQSIHDMLSGGDEVQDFIIIGVGPPKEMDALTANKRRIYQFSPANWPMEDKFGKAMAGFCRGNSLSLEECVGGGPIFFNFLTEELLPTLMDNFKIDKNDLGLVGYSAGGSFASYAMFQDNSPFQKYILSSAATWGDGLIYRLEEQWSQNHDDFPITLYMGSGSLEMDDGFMEGTAAIVSSQLHLAGLLKSRGYKSLKIKSDIHMGFGHSDATLATLVHGIRMLYKK